MKDIPVKNPFISICIPTYKNVHYVQRLLQSVAEQTFNNYEVVITDNSPDNLIEVLAKSYAGKLPIHYYKNNPATGMAENFNIVLHKAKGEWIKMMHDDDWFASAESLQKFADVALVTSKKFIFSAYNDIHTSGKQVNEYFTAKKKQLLDGGPLNLFLVNVIGHPSTVMHKKDDAVLYDPQFNWVTDIDFYIQYLLKHPGYEYLPEMLINIGIDDKQMSSAYYKNPKVEIPEYFNLLNKYSINLTDYKYVFHLFWMLVRRFKIKTIQYIRTAGYTGLIPDELNTIINYQKKIPRIILKQTPFSNYFMKKCLLLCKKLL